MMHVPFNSSGIILWKAVFPCSDES